MSNVVKRTAGTLLLVLTLSGAWAQQFYRIRADVSVKEKFAGNRHRLTIGRVYYDKLYHKLVYKLSFPQPETIVMQDSNAYVLNERGDLTDVRKSPMLPDFSIFHLALTNRLADYGLKSAEIELYRLARAEKQDGRIITTWEPKDARVAKVLGNIRMASVGKRLDALAMYGPDGRLMSSQFFKHYVTVGGVDFPTEVTQYVYPKQNPKQAVVQHTTYRNVVVDQADEHHIYRHPVPLAGRAKLGR